MKTSSGFNRAVKQDKVFHKKIMVFPPFFHYFFSLICHHPAIVSTFSQIPKFLSMNKLTKQKLIIACQKSYLNKSFEIMKTIVSFSLLFFKRLKKKCK